MHIYFKLKQCRLRRHLVDTGRQLHVFLQKIVHFMDMKQHTFSFHKNFHEVYLFYSLLTWTNMHK